MIKRGKKGTMQQCLEQSADRLKRGICVGLFPQGTRAVPSATQPPLEFKKGFVVMAAKVRDFSVEVIFTSTLLIRPSLGAVKKFKHASNSPYDYMFVCVTRHNCTMLLNIGQGKDRAAHLPVRAQLFVEQPRHVVSRSQSHRSQTGKGRAFDCNSKPKRSSCYPCFKILLLQLKLLSFYFIN